MIQGQIQAPLFSFPLLLLLPLFPALPALQPRTLCPLQAKCEIAAFIHVWPAPALRECGGEGVFLPDRWRHRTIGKTHKDNYIISYSLCEAHKFPPASTQNGAISAAALHGSILLQASCIFLQGWSMLCKTEQKIPGRLQMASTLPSAARVLPWLVQGKVEKRESPCPQHKIMISL